MEKKNSKKTLVIVLVLLGVFFAYILYVNGQPGKYDEFAQCIVDSGTKIYSAWWCPHCQDQKKAFGKSFRVLEDGNAHIECSPNNVRTLSQYCKDEGIEGTPTWRFPNGKDMSGQLSLYTIALESGCEDFLE